MAGITITINMTDGSILRFEDTDQALADTIRLRMNMGGMFHVKDKNRIILVNAAHITHVILVGEGEVK